MTVLRRVAIVLAVILLIAPFMLHAYVKVYVTNSDGQISVLNADNNSFIKNFTPTIDATTAGLLQGGCDLAGRIYSLLSFPMRRTISIRFPMQL